MVSKALNATHHYWFFDSVKFSNSNSDSDSDSAQLAPKQGTAGAVGQPDVPPGGAAPNDWYR